MNLWVFLQYLSYFSFAKGLKNINKVCSLYECFYLLTLNRQTHLLAIDQQGYTEKDVGSQFCISFCLIFFLSLLVFLFFIFILSFILPFSFFLSFLFILSLFHSFFFILSFILSVILYLFILFFYSLFYWFFHFFHSFFPCFFLSFSLINIILTKRLYGFSSVLIERIKIIEALSSYYNTERYATTINNLFKMGRLKMGVHRLLR